MAKQNTTSQATKRVAKAAIVVLALIILASGLDQSVAVVCNSLPGVMREAVALVPSFVLTAWQALQPEAAAHDHFPVCAVQALLFWPLLETVSKTA